MKVQTKAKVEKALPLVISIASIVGVGVTAVVSAKCQTKAVRSIDKAEAEKGSPLSKKEKAKLELKAHIPTIITGAITAGAMTTATIINERQKAALTMTASLMTARYNELKNSIQKMDPEERKKLMEERFKEDMESGHIQRDAGTPRDPEAVLWHEDHFGYFFATKDEVYGAIIEMMRLLSHDGVTTLEVFADYVKDLSGMFVNEAYSGNIKDTISHIGWSDEWVFECDNSLHIPFYIEEYKLEPGTEPYAETCHEIQWLIDPIFEPWEYYSDCNGVKPEAIHA